MWRLLLAWVLSVSLAACGGSKNPAGPSNTTPPAVTRILLLEGGLDFGGVGLGQSFTRGFTIRNQGTAPLTITSLSGPHTSNFAASWTDGTIPVNGSQDVTIRFTPTAVQSYNGTLTVNGDQTSGTNTIPITARGTLDGVPLYSRSGSGDTVFDGMPAYVTRVKVVGVYTQRSSNFIVRVNGRLIVNELLGTSWGTTRYEGILSLPSGPGTVEITNSSGVTWTIEESRPS